MYCLFCITYFSVIYTYCFCSFFFFNDTATTEIYTLSLHDALPISASSCSRRCRTVQAITAAMVTPRSEEHTSELQSRLHLVCRLLLEKKKKKNTTTFHPKKKTKKQT